MELNTIIENVRIVYVRSTEGSNKYIPAWEYKLDSGELIHIDYVSGNEIK